MLELEQDFADGLLVGLGQDWDGRQVADYTDY